MGKRDYKQLAEGEIYHIYNRGNNREKIFYDEQDYRALLYRIGLALGLEEDVLNTNELTKAPRSRIRITKTPTPQFRLHAFCIMPNHFHLLLEQVGKTKISKLMHKVSTSFSMYMNKKYNRVGHIFQGRYKSVLIESNPQLMWTTSYIHMNPVKDKLTRSPDKYKWSSYGYYSEIKNLPILDKRFLLEVFETINNFKKQNVIYSKETMVPIEAR